MANIINEILNKIEEIKFNKCISLEDYPSSNHFAQAIAERAKIIKSSLEEFNRYDCIEKGQLNNLIQGIWSKDALRKDAFNDDIDKIINNGDELENNEEYVRKFEDLKKVVDESFVCFKNTFNLINSVEGVKIEEDNLTIKKLYDCTALLPQYHFINSGYDDGLPKWEKLCNKYDSCKCVKKSSCCYGTIVFGLIILVLAVMLILGMSDKLIGFSQKRRIDYVFIFLYVIAILSAIVMLSWKFIQFQAKRSEIDSRLKEKMMNAVLEAFHEDRESARQRTKVEIALYDKLEKARIEEWCCNKEYERKLNVMEQERIAELSKVLLELAKVKNTVTLSDPKGSGKTVTVERSVLSEDCCCELKNVFQDFIKENSHRCKMFEEILKCMSENPVGCEKLRTCLKSFPCDKGDCEGKCKELSEYLGKIANAVEKMSCGGTSTVINNCK